MTEKHRRIILSKPEREKAASEKARSSKPPVAKRKGGPSDPLSLVAESIASSQTADRSNQPRPGETFETEFLDNMAHQMVAPLQSIEMHCQGIIDGIVPLSESASRLREVVGHVRILEQLARRMRFLHELVSGKKVDSERVEFEKIVTVWIAGFNNYLPATRSLKMEADIDLKMNALPDVIASHLAVHQVIVNLYDNAVKYGAQGSRLSVRARVKDGFVINEFSHLAKVVLTDSAARDIFTRGFRAEEARALRASGTGVGMWISKQLMMSLGGDLRAIPTDSNGKTRFLLSWKIA